MKLLKYQLMTEVNHGTEEHPDIQQIFSGVSLGWSEANEELAKREAYNGEYTIEDVTIKLTVEEQIAELKAQLAATDYKAIKYAEGWITEEEYAPIRAERQALRDKINVLEGGAN